MFIRNWKKDVFTIPNLLSLFRLLLIPVYISIYLKAKQPSSFLLSGAILGLSCLTDLLDGWIARRFNMVTTLGKILDPIADKLTQFSLLLCLYLKYPQILYILLLFILKESFQGIVGFIYLRRGQMLPGALMAGKICTAVLFVSLILLIALPNPSHRTVGAITLVDSFFLVHSFAHYFAAYFGTHALVQDCDE
jgi:cardiolipin synthase